MRQPVPALPVSAGQREVLESVARSQSAPHREVVRARALLMAADGRANTAIARALSVSPGSVSGWRARFAEDGLVKFAQVREGRGRKKTIPEEKIAEIVDLTLNHRPEGETHWSCRTMAAATGVSKSTVQRMWSARGLKPHRVETFKLSNDPHFDEKLVDVVGLYLNPPEKAIVLCVDEKSQVQALDRTQPAPADVKGRGGTMTHDYKRHGTTTLFAALNVLTGIVIGQCYASAPAPRVAQVPQGHRRARCRSDLQIHLILDNYATHNHADVRPVAGQAPPVPPALHPDHRLLAQPGRTLVPGTDRQSVAPRRVPLRPRPRRRHRGLPRRPQQRPQTLRLDRHRRGNPGQSRRGRITLEKVS